MAETNYEIKSDDTGTQVAAPVFPYQPRLPKTYRLKIGLIGCGGISEAHLGAYSEARLNIVALCDRIADRAEKRKEQFYPEAELYTDFRELLARPDIEVVDIATHPEDRVEIIEAALRAGKHVLSQKPFVTNLDTGEELVRLAESVGKKLAVNQNGRWAPHFSYMRQAVQAGVVGDVLGAHLRVHWSHDWIAGTPFDDVHHVILYDFAIHWFDMLSCFLGARPATRVFASLTSAAGQTAKPPLLGQALVEYEGAQASLAFDGLTLFGTEDYSIVTGTKGTLLSRGPDLGRQAVTLTTEAGVASPELTGSWFPNGFLGTMGELLCSIDESREPGNSAENNLRSLALCFAALRSVETGLPQTPGKVRSLP